MMSWLKLNFYAQLFGYIDSTYEACLFSFVLACLFMLSSLSANGRLTLDTYNQNIVQRRTTKIQLCTCTLLQDKEIYYANIITHSNATYCTLC